MVTFPTGTNPERSGLQPTRPSRMARPAQSSLVTTQIWIEPVKRPDGRNWYSERWGLLLRTRLGGPDGAILCDRVHNPVCESARALMARGITGQFETHKSGIAYACMMGDIEKTAGLTIREPDSVDDARPVHFTKWKPFDLDAVSHRAGLAPASAETDPGMGRTCRRERLSTVGPELIPEAAE